MSFSSAEIDALFDPVLTGRAVIAFSTGEVSEADAILTADYEGMLGDAVEGVQVLAYCKSREVEGIRHGDKLIAGDSEYKVIGVQPQMTGITILILTRAE